MKKWSYEELSYGVKKYTGSYISPESLKLIEKNHGLTASDLKQIWNNIEYLKIFPLVINAMIRYPDEDFDSVRTSQIESKEIAVDHLMPFIEYTDNIAVVGCWHGILSLILAYEGFQCTYSSDLSSNSMDVTKYLGSFGEQQDMFKQDLSPFDVVVNTSFEHVSEDWLDRLYIGQKICLQTTNMQHETHINTVETREQFREQIKRHSITPAKIVEHEFTGPVPDMKKYKRFTLIGAV